MKSYLLAAALSAFCLSNPARAESWTKGGPISNAMEAAVASKDKRALKKIWSGKILLVENGFGPLTSIKAEKFFKMVDGCTVWAKYDDWRTQTEEEKEELKGLVSWNCPAKPIAGKDCEFEQYSLEFGVMRPLSDRTGLYVVPGTGYDSKRCGKPRSPEKIEAGAQ